MTESPHSEEPATLLGRLGVDPAQGLSSDEASRRLAAHGPNVLRAHQGRSAWTILAAQFRSLIVLLLAAAAGILLAFGEIQEVHAPSRAAGSRVATGW